MSNDNDPRDDAMREIEAALDEFADLYREQWTSRSFDPSDARRAGEASDKLLALIRSKLPQPDAEHERAVEAWRQAMCRAIERLTKHANKRGEEAQFFGELFGPVKERSDEALRLMRARPAPHTFYGGTERSYAELVAKEKAAAGLLRAAKALLDESDIIQCDNPSVIPRFLDAIAKAERAGIKP